MPPICNWPPTSGSQPPRTSKNSSGFPDKPLGRRCLRALIDIRLERLLDLEWGQIYADAAVKWYDSSSPPPPGEVKGEGTKSPRLAGEGPVRATFSPTPSPRFRRHPPAQWGSRLRCLFAGGDWSLPISTVTWAALACLEKGEGIAPPQNIQVVYGKISTGIERLVEIAKTGKSTTPDVVLRATRPSNGAVTLADFTTRRRSTTGLWNFATGSWMQR